MTKKISLLENIEKQIENLTPQDQLKLVERIAHLLRKSGINEKKELSWSKLYGKGKGLWNSEDAQKYIDRLREDRI